MKLRSIFLAAASLSGLALAQPAAAVPVACIPPQPTGSVSITGGNTCQLTAVATPVTAVFIYQNASYDSTLSLSLAGYSSIFQNHVNAFGDLALLNVTPGQLLDFAITNVDGTFIAGDNSTDGIYHAAYRDYAHYSDFNLPAISSSVLNVLNANGGVSNYIFVAFEDMKNGGDKDYNDLVFAFTNTAGTTDAPEPITLSLFGAGLLGAAGMRRKARKA